MSHAWHLLLAHRAVQLLLLLLLLLLLHLCLCLRLLHSCELLGLRCLHQCLRRLRLCRRCGSVRHHPVCLVVQKQVVSNTSAVCMIGMCA